MSHWSDQGITDTFGKPLADIDYKAAILLPSGHTGPIFAVYPNFNVIMAWNRSTHYALSVGRLADRVAGAGRLRRTLPTDATLAISPDALKSIQEGLNEPEGLKDFKGDGYYFSAKDSDSTTWVFLRDKAPKAG